MPDLLAKGTAAAVAALLVLSVGFLVYSSQPKAGAKEVKAEFDSAFPLVEGMHVRVDGAIAGSAASIEVNDQGNAVVTMTLHDSIEQPMDDATAAIRQQDTTGDSYVAFDPGGDDSDQPLGEEGIVCSDYDTCPQTLVAPRLDDLLNAFGPSERAGVQLLLVELSRALDRRGADLNAAAIELRPALVAANEALAQVNEQNDALKSLITSAESVTSQAAERDEELGRLVESLARTTRATAADTGALDAGLEKLPETVERARTTLAALSRAAVAARPLAEQLAAGAPDLAQALELLPGFLVDTEDWIQGSLPTLDLTRKVLRAAAPTLEVGNRRIITGPFDLSGATADLLNSVLGGEDAFPALFGDDSYGEAGAGTLEAAGFGAVAVEPGNIPGSSYGADHADRTWLRVSAIINCEVFGLPVRPGCLADAISGASGAPTRKGSSLGDLKGVRDSLPERGDAGGGAAPLIPGGAAVDEITDGLDDLIGGGNNGGQAPMPDIGAVEDLLDFLQG